MVPWAGAKSLKFPVVTRLGSGTVKGQHMALKTTNRFNSAKAQKEAGRHKQPTASPSDPNSIPATRMRQLLASLGGLNSIMNMTDLCSNWHLWRAHEVFTRVPSIR